MKQVKLHSESLHKELKLLAVTEGLTLEKTLQKLLDFYNEKTILRKSGKKISLHTKTKS